jgi:alkanesulfonate monooxygenase SsuD/methylene tetrahydromethanopterin reductase-like flavin-dependent oxidoreductase (luciferase family)
MDKLIHFGLCLPADPNPGMTGEEYITSVQQGITMLSDHIDSLWFVDHLQNNDSPLLEGWTALTYWAALQPQLALGHLVLCQSFRNPALLAKMAATLQYLTGGRFILGIGAGWKEDEYRAYGYEYPSAGMRVMELEETLQILKACWTEKQATIGGKRHQITDLSCEPKPDPVPPLLIGGTKPRMLRLIARYADWWNVSWCSIEKYRQFVAECERACDEVGRDPATLRRTWFGGCICVENEAELQKLTISKMLLENALVGTSQQIIEQMHSFLELGVEHFEFAWGPDPQSVMRNFELLANEVLPFIHR